MSYDLSFQTTGASTLKAAKLAARHGCEHWERDDGVGIALQLDDERVVELYRALVKLAKEHGATLHDPQLGADVDLTTPGRFPPLWRPSGPVHGKSFKAKVKSFLIDHLRPHGFERQTAWTAIRTCEDLHQGINFQPGRSRLSGRFTANIYWTFTLRPLAVPEAMHVNVRLEQYLREAGLVAEDDPFRGWPASAPPEALDRSFEQARQLFDETIIPLLNELRTVEAIVAAFEAGRLDVPRAFGTKVERMADCYRHVGRLDDGRRRHETYLSSLEGTERRGLPEWIAAERSRAATHFA